MNETELRELDGWIAEHVLGWKWFRYLKERSPEYSERRTLMDKPNRYVRKAKGAEPLAADAFYNIPKSSTDPSAALMVLKRCAKETVFPILTGVKADGWYCELGVGVLTGGPTDIDDWKGQKTLELAICLFAKKLFA
jgi:hypothetical protein